MRRWVCNWVISDSSFSCRLRFSASNLASASCLATAATRCICVSTNIDNQLNLDAGPSSHVIRAVNYNQQPQNNRNPHSRGATGKKKRKRKIKRDWNIRENRMKQWRRILEVPTPLPAASGVPGAARALCGWPRRIGVVPAPAGWRRRRRSPPGSPAARPAARRPGTAATLRRTRAGGSHLQPQQKKKISRLFHPQRISIFKIRGGSLQTSHLHTVEEGTDSTRRFTHSINTRNKYTCTYIPESIPFSSESFRNHGRVSEDPEWAKHLAKNRHKKSIQQSNGISTPENSGGC